MAVRWPTAVIQWEGGYTVCDVKYAANIGAMKQ